MNGGWDPRKIWAQKTGGKFKKNYGKKVFLKKYLKLPSNQIKIEYLRMKKNFSFAF